MLSRERVLDFDLYPVTCERLSAGRSNLAVLDALLAGGARIVQLREKDLGDRDFVELAREFRRRTAQADVALVINDRVDVCLAVAADGVHLGQGDFPLGDARRLLGPLPVIGVSTHSVEEARLAVALGADYINVGPIFETRTKEHLGPPVGLELFRRVRDEVSVPVTVMGGISLENVAELVRAGARRLAVVSAVVGAPDIAATVRELRRRIAAGRP